ncbi:clip3 [Symbiodinium microadriaticum]|nr:clip3 [Symbiodinium microadriaticum]
MLQPVKHNFIASVSLRCVSPWLDEGVPEVGQRVVYCSDYGLAGVVKFAGSTEFSDGHDWVGIMLDKPRGKNDGRVKDKQYFTCPPNHGLFMRAKVLLPEEAVAEVAEQPPEQLVSFCFRFCQVQDCSDSEEVMQKVIATVGRGSDMS